VWLILLGIAYEAWMRVCEERFPLVRVVGNVLGALSVAIVIFYAVDAAHGDLKMWMIGALNGVDRILQLIVYWWFIAGFVLVLWFVSGVIAARSNVASNSYGEMDGVSRAAQARASVATGRMGLVVSLGFFIVLSMTAWALIETTAEQAAADVPFTSKAFPTPSSGPAQSAAGAGSAALPAPSPGKNEQADQCAKLKAEEAPHFLCERFVNSTETFAAIVILLGVLVVYLALMLAPSMLAEVSVAKPDGQKLGLWLTRGYRWIEPAVGAIVAAGVIASVLVGIVLVAFQLNLHAITDWASAQLESWRLSSESQKLLAHVVVVAGSATIALAAAGRILSRYVPWLRAPLDAALDVDNHFREFPRKAIPRARIFSRFASVLEHVAEGNYDHIVIVAHSQGTVISAELLRYLKEVTETDRAGPRIAAMWNALKAKVAVITAGCPLRQLYAARFPVLYDWVLGERGGTTGPAAAAIGATRWVNLYATGDYVGRWLWSRPPLPMEYPPSEIDEAGTAHKSMYEAPKLDLVDLNDLLRGSTETDICLGPGAHTHYFDRDQTTVARVVDAMLI
jgi:hypothetical protein